MNTTQLVKVIVSDLDGTLLNGNHTVSQATKTAITKAAQAGYEIILATGRHYIDCSVIRDMLGLSSYLITCNGAMLHGKQGELLQSAIIPAHIVNDLLTNFDIPKQVHANFYGAQQWLVLEEDDTLAQYHKDSGFHYQVATPTQIVAEPCLKFYFSAPKAEYLFPLEEQLRAKYNNELSITYAIPEYMEVMVKGISKGAALTRVLNTLNIQPEQAIAFGDGMNDFEMLSLVGQPIVMENANPNLVKAMPNAQRIGSNTNDSLANYINQYLL